MHDDDLHVALLSARAGLIELLRAAIARDLEPAVDAFVRKLLALPDRTMRGLALSERLIRMDLPLCLGVLQALLDRSMGRDADAHEVLLDLTTARPLMERLGYERARRLYELARAQEQYALARMLLSPDAQLRLHRGPDPGWENQHMQDTSLGWRKTLARGTDRLALDRLLHDRNPTVIRHLLDNPRILERDVVRVAAMRPANPDCLAEVFTHGRWVRRYRVRSALALNPSTPLDIALSLLPQLMLPDLRYAADAETLDPTVRSVAQEIVGRRASHRRGRGRVAGDSPSALSDSELDDLKRGLEHWSAR